MNWQNPQRVDSPYSYCVTLHNLCPWTQPSMTPANRDRVEVTTSQGNPPWRDDRRGSNDDAPKPSNSHTCLRCYQVKVWSNPAAIQV